MSTPLLGFTARTVLAAASAIQSCVPSTETASAAVPTEPVRVEVCSEEIATGPAPTALLADTAKV